MRNSERTYLRLVWNDGPCDRQVGQVAALEEPLDAAGWFEVPFAQLSAVMDGLERYRIQGHEIAGQLRFWVQIAA